MILPEASPKHLQQALDRRADGASMETATGLHPGASELEGLIVVAESLQALPREEPPAHAVAVARERYLAEGGRRRAAWVHEPRRIRHRVARHPRPTHHGRWMLVVALGVLIAMVAGSLLALAAMTSSPDGPLYGVRLQGERLLIAVNRDPVAQASVRIDVANARYRDSEDMADRGNGDLAVSSLTAFYDNLRTSAHQLAAQKKHNAAWKAARDKYAKAEDKTADSIIHQLTEHGDKDAVASVAALQQQFVKDRAVLDPELGIKPAATGGGSTIQGAPSQSDQPTQPTAKP